MHGRLEHLGGSQQWLEEGSPGKGELNSYPQPADFSVAVAGERKVQRSLLSRERPLTPDFPLEVEMGRWTSGRCGQPFLWLLSLSGIEVDGLGVRLCRCGRTIRHINVHP